MPRPTRAEVEAALARLPPEEHAGFLAEVERRLREPESAEPAKAPTPFDAAMRATRGAATDPEALSAGFLGDTGPAAAAGTVTAASMAANPVAFGKAALGSYLGSKIGGSVGHPVLGSLAGAALAPAMSMGTIGGMIQGGVPGVLRWAAGRAVAAAPKAAAPAAAAPVYTAAEQAAAAAGRSATSMAPAAVAAPQTIGSMISASVPASVAPAATTATAVAAPAGKAFNTIWREFAKAAAPNAKKGERIWLKLDEKGIPVDVITPGQASRVAKDMKTWVSRTW